eukprot:superscaffoldBa00001192_g9435
MRKSDGLENSNSLLSTFNRDNGAPTAGSPQANLDFTKSDCRPQHPTCRWDRSRVLVQFDWASSVSVDKQAGELAEENQHQRERQRENWFCFSLPGPCRLLRPQIEFWLSFETRCTSGKVTFLVWIPLKSHQGSGLEHSYHLCWISAPGE